MIKCEVCGTLFKGKGPRPKYCSSKCVNVGGYEIKKLNYEWRLNKLCAMAKNRAKTKDLQFNLSKQYLIDLWNANGGCCEVTKIPFELGNPEKGKVHPYAPPIDRINPELGYVKGNVRIVAYQLNVALSEFGLEQFNNFIGAYLENVPFR